MGTRERRLSDLLTEMGSPGHGRGDGELEPMPTEPREGAWGRVQAGEGRAYRVI